MVEIWTIEIKILIGPKAGRKDPLPQEKKLYYVFLKLNYRGIKGTDISSLAVAGIASNSWVTYVTIKISIIN